MLATAQVSFVPSSKVAFGPLVGAIQVRLCGQAIDRPYDADYLYRQIQKDTSLVTTNMAGTIMEYLTLKEVVMPKPLI